jgi:hypothetical protein
MCERRDAREAQDAAARRLTEACRHIMCPDDMGAALKRVYDDTLDEPVPYALLQLVGRLQ